MTVHDMDVMAEPPRMDSLRVTEVSAHTLAAGHWNRNVERHIECCLRVDEAKVHRFRGGGMRILSVYCARFINSNLLECLIINGFRFVGQ
ncbi:hypothetical protein [Shewanella schlegeliana]|uniref:hypothetical protein n=1 Tax=Shewanella schlegeliana TaxID=190308 RepID=UPI001C7DD08F|nr:hypothetical protein [Shewanella schlegeliana]